MVLRTPCKCVTTPVDVARERALARWLWHEHGRVLFDRPGLRPRLPRRSRLAQRARWRSGADRSPVLSSNRDRASVAGPRRLRTIEAVPASPRDGRSEARPGAPVAYGPMSSPVVQTEPEWDSRMQGSGG